LKTTLDCFKRNITKRILDNLVNRFLTADHMLKRIKSTHMSRKGQSENNSSVLSAVEWLNKIFGLAAQSEYSWRVTSIFKRWMYGSDYPVFDKCVLLSNILGYLFSVTSIVIAETEDLVGGYALSFTSNRKEKI
jgi:hypothetical protein